MRHLFSKLFRKSVRPNRLATRNVRPVLESLEDRLVPDAGFAKGFLPGLDHLFTPRGPLDTPPAVVRFDPATRLPLLHSNPGARATLFLDFDGNHEDSWFHIPEGPVIVTPDGPAYPTFHDVRTPAFDLDGRPGSLDRREQQTINEIWAQVAEDYAPFDIDVTTEYAGPFTDRVALRVAVGGHNDDWFHDDDAAGFSSVGSFADAAPNVVFVFSEYIAERVRSERVDQYGNPLQVATGVASVISHEAGHAFGLKHHQMVVAGEVKEYDVGTAERTPIMGSSQPQNRHTWGLGRTDLQADGIFTLQDDMAILAGDQNGFGYRRDDHGNNAWSATALGDLSVRPFGLTASGIIEKTSDVDAFSFRTTGGQLTVRVDVAAFGPNLDARVELWSGNRLIRTADPAGSLGATMSLFVSPGEYTVRVLSHGTYGDVGQYTLALTPGFVPAILPGRIITVFPPRLLPEPPPLPVWLQALDLAFNPQVKPTATWLFELPLPVTKTAVQKVVTPLLK